MRYVLCVIALAVLVAHHLPIAAINSEVSRRARQDADTIELVSTYKKVPSSERLLELYH